jgi:ABC-type polysaccharide/polyol phosphate transport system ATPase subunit
MGLPIISFEHVSKKYRVGQLGAKSIREELTQSLARLMPGSARPRDDEFFALRDVSLHVERAETVGVIGPNGSGKSTILKLLAHIIFAAAGRISVGGSVASLIEVGAGFHPELTGRENVYLYGSMMGMRRQEVGARFNEIVEFAGIERFLDVPLKRYSLGMYMRLGFSVAAHINPDILLLDEVLAVGDAAFQSKCLERVEALRRAGMTIVFVSHDMAAIERLCHRVYFLQHGQICSEGEARRVVRDYYDAVVQHSADVVSPADKQARTLLPTLTGVRFVNGDGLESDTFTTGQPLVAVVEYASPERLADGVVELSFHSPDGRLHCQLTSETLDPEPLPPRGVVEITCDELSLAPGLYLVDATLARRCAVDVHDRRPRCASLRVLPGRPMQGMFYAPHRSRVLPAAVLEVVR